MWRSGSLSALTSGSGSDSCSGLGSGTVAKLLSACAAIPVIYYLLPAWAQERGNALLKLLKLLIAVRTHAHKNGNKLYSFADRFEASVDDPALRDNMLIRSVDADADAADKSSSYTFAQMDARANQCAHWYLHMHRDSDGGSDSTSTVALLMGNCPDYVAFWLGMAKAGASTALLNTNAKGRTLTHSIFAGLGLELSSAASTAGKKRRYVVTDAEGLLSLSVASVKRALADANATVLLFSDLQLQTFPEERLTKKQCPARASNKEGDAILYIYTSGTTGLPKASKISHGRYTVSCHPLRIMCSFTSTDVLYSPLPLYHSAAGMMGVGACLMSGACFVTRRRFSVQNFSADVLKTKATVLQYIGELCRYLASAPENKLDKQLKNLRYAFGNGLRRDVWSAFQDRYSIKHIAEFYGATEGNTVLLNATGHVGALGWVPRAFDFLYPVCIIKIHSSDSDSELEGTPLRRAIGKGSGNNNNNSDAAAEREGRCVLADTGEVGLVIGAIDPKRSDRRFDGYQDAKASAAKLLHNVFKEGDCYFNTGDLMSRDSSGFFYWADRTGDTFRWKGENISTTEIEILLNELPFIEDCSSYGVEIKGCDGKAGMVSVKLRDASGLENQTPSITPLNTPSGTPNTSNTALSRLAMDSLPRASASAAAVSAVSNAATTAPPLELTQAEWQQFNGLLLEHLQPSARPRFVRFVKHLPMTSTYKRIKHDLLMQAYHPKECCSDSLFSWSGSEKRYVPLRTMADYDAVSGSTVG